MKIPITIIAPKFLKAISIVVDIVAITLYPFIISREKMSEDVLNHESIHIAQQKELFEQEAYAHMFNEHYIDNRKPYSWRKYRV